VVICRRGQRSCEAAALLEKAGFGHVYNVLGGYEDLQSLRRIDLAEHAPGLPLQARRA
jgi:hypothetical protein